MFRAIIASRQKNHLRYVQIAGITKGNKFSHLKLKQKWLNMKNPLDPRHKKRETLMKKLFAWDFNNKKIIRDPQFKKIAHSLKLVDEKISKAAPQWPIDKIAKIDLAILRLAVYEMCVIKTEPYKVIIDEAVELSKEYGNNKTPNFINGVLGTVLIKNK